MVVYLYYLCLGKGEALMLKKTVWLTCAMLLCTLLIALPAAQTALASGTGVAKIGDTTYPTLVDAVAAVTGSTPVTITLLTDATGNGIKVEAPKNITFDLGGHTYNVDGTTVGSSGTETNGFQLLKGSAVTFKNGTITSDKAKILIQNYCDLTLENVVLDGSTLVGAGPYTLSLNNGNVNITGNTSILAKPNGGVAFDLYYWPKNGYTDGVQVTVNTTGTISGPIELSQDGTGAAAAANHNRLTIQNINHEGTISNYNVGQYDNSIVKINGGTFAYAPTKYTGDTVVSTGGDYYVGAQANAVLSNPNTKEVTVLQANGALTVADGIKLTNSTGDSITVNGNSIEDNSALLIHDWEEVPAKAPTCTEAGHAAYWVCRDCRMMVDNSGNALTAVPVIPATGHSYQNGVCTVCGAREDVPAPVTPPKTGDSAHPLLWSVVLLAALLGAGVLCAGLRKRFR